MQMLDYKRMIDMILLFHNPDEKLTINILKQLNQILIIIILDYFMEMLQQFYLSM